MSDRKDDKQEPKTDISNSKNVVNRSDIQGKNVHIGDVYHNYGGSDKQPASPGQPQLETIRELIGKARTEEAFRKLKEITNGREDGTYDEVTALSNQWKTLKREERMGLLSSSEAGIRNNKITNALLQILRDLAEA